MSKLLRTLIIEDSEMDAELEIEALKQGDFSPIYQRVETSEEMLKALASASWDIVLSDYSLPKFSGPEALAVLQASGLDIPFIMISGTVGEEVAVTSLKAGAHDFLVKGQLTRLIPAISRELEEAQQRQAARLLEKKFLMTFEQAAVGIAHISATGQWLMLNQKYCQILGYSHLELMGHTFQEVTYPEDIDVDLEQFQQLQAGKIPSYTLEKRYTRKDGSLVWVNLTVSGIWNGGFEYAIAVIEDITERKAMEQALKDSEERYRLILEGSNDGIWDYSFVTQQIFWNERFSEITGFPLEGRNEQGWEFLLSRIHPAQLPPIQAEWQKSIETQSPYQGSCRFQHAHGHYIDLFIKGKSVQDEQGHVYRASGVIVDITPLKQAQQALEDHAHRLEQSNQELEQFTTIASHDLQEPLRKIMVFSEMLASTISPEGEDALHRLQNAVTRMQNLLNALLSLSRINRKGQPFRAVDLNEVLGNVLDDLQLALQETQGQVLREPLMVIVGDETQIYQLFQNLIGNAIKYHREHVPPLIKVSGQISEDRQFYQIMIEDNGIGIKEEHYTRIFEPFQRLHGASLYPGTGMGLTICQKIIERHRGGLIVSSQLGQGSQFKVFLPLSAGDRSVRLPGRQ